MVKNIKKKKNLHKKNYLNFITFFYMDKKNFENDPWNLDSLFETVHTSSAVLVLNYSLLLS